MTDDQSHMYGYKLKAYICVKVVNRIPTAYVLFYHVSFRELISTKRFPYTKTQLLELKIGSFTVKNRVWKLVPTLTEFNALAESRGV